MSFINLFHAAIVKRSQKCEKAKVKQCINKILKDPPNVKKDDHQKHSPEAFCKKKGVLKNFAIFTEKNLFWSLSLIHFQPSSPHKFLGFIFTFYNVNVSRCIF